MVTNPNTLGLFEDNIAKVADVVHAKGGPGLRGRRQHERHHGHRQHVACRRCGCAAPEPAQNLFHAPRRRRTRQRPGMRHRTSWRNFCRCPGWCRMGSMPSSYDYPDSIGKIHAFYGNFSILIRAYSYIRSLGADLEKGESIRGAECQLYQGEPERYVPSAVRPALYARMRLQRCQSRKRTRSRPWTSPNA
jgi:glycine dehydrogenase subunit 2